MKTILNNINCNKINTFYQLSERIKTKSYMQDKKFLILLFKTVKSVLIIDIFFIEETFSQSILEENNLMERKITISHVLQNHWNHYGYDLLSFKGILINILIIICGYLYLKYGYELFSCTYILFNTIIGISGYLWSKNGTFSEKPQEEAHN